MTNAIITDLEAVLAKVKAEFQPAAAAVEADASAIGSASLAFIKAHGLQDLYQVALTVVAAMAPGASWAATLASIEAQAVTDGKELVAGSTAIAASMAQADLIAAGKLLPPASSAS